VGGGATRASGYDNHLKWHEVAKLKADLMNVRHRWVGVSVDSTGARCLELGLRTEDVREIVGLVAKAQAGRRLVPQAYRDFHFQQPVDPPRSSRDW
jgi:hypothetical protein